MPVGQIWPVAPGLPPTFMSSDIIVLHLISIHIHFLPGDCVPVSLAPNTVAAHGRCQSNVNKHWQKDQNRGGREAREAGRQGGRRQTGNKFIDGSFYYNCLAYGAHGTRQPETSYF